MSKPMNRGKQSYGSPSIATQSSHNPMPHISPSPSDLFLDTSSSIHPNAPWGDELDSKQPNSLRIYFQNVNGLQPTPTWDKWKEMLSELYRNDVDVAGLVEAI